MFFTQASFPLEMVLEEGYIGPYHATRCVLIKELFACGYIGGRALHVCDQSVPMGKEKRASRGISLPLQTRSCVLCVTPSSSVRV